MAKSRFLRKVVGQDRDLNQLQANVGQAVSDAIRSPLLDGLLLDNVALTTSSTRIEHKLGRAPRGYIIVKKNANAQVYDSLASEASPDLFLPLTSSANVTVSIWVF